jgi:signal peptide peptidase SppA
MNRYYSNVFTKIRDSAWLMTEDSLRMMLDIFERRALGLEISEDEYLAIAARTADRSGGRVQASGSIGVIPIAGPIFPKANMMTEMSGATSLEQWRTQFRALMANDLVSTIVMDIDSPGGSSDLVMEMGDEIRAARDIKPVVAVANTLAASAAYWLGAQASAFYATPSGSVGSVGVYAVHEDKSREQEMKGIKTTIVSAGPNKVDGNPYEPISATAQARMQKRVDEMYGFFIDAVAKGRNTSTQDVIDNYGGGSVLSAQEALGLGMIDGVQTFEDTVGQLLSNAQPSMTVTTGSRISVVNASDTVMISVPTVGSTTNVSYDADKEHSEPGTGQGGEPTPRTPPEDGDKGIAGGWRRDTPPIVNELEQEGSVMTREQLVALADRLGIAVDDSLTDEELSVSVLSGIDDVVGPLIEARDAGSTARSFAMDYPDQYVLLQESIERNRLADAREFADGVEKFADGKYGFSANVTSLVEDAHMKLAAKQFQLADFEQFVAAIANNGVISISEEGSSRQRERTAGNGQGTTQEIRQEFVALVKDRQEQDSLDFASARNLVAEENPELAQAYLNS